MSALRNSTALAEEYLRLRASLLAEFPELAEDVHALADTLDGLSDATDVVASLIRGAQEDSAFAAALGSIIDDNRTRKSRIEARAERRREAALKLMTAMEVKKVERPDFTVHLAAGRPSVVIADPDAVPDAFCRFERKPDKARIKEELEAFGDVPGASLSNATPQIRVVVK